MTKIQDRPSKEETREAGKYLKVEPFIRASYLHALKFYSERSGIDREELKQCLFDDARRLDARPEHASNTELIAERVNDRLLLVLQDRYGFDRECIIEGMKTVGQGPL